MNRSTLLRRLGLALSALLAVSALPLFQSTPDLPLGIICLVFAVVASLSIARETQLAALLKQPTQVTSILASTVPVLVTLFFYRDVLDTWFLADDLMFVVNHQSLDLSGTLEWWYPRSFSDSVKIIRPISHSCSWLLIKLFGFTAFPSHLLNVLLHAASAGLLARLTIRLTGQPLLGLVAGFGFAVQPLTVTTVAWIATHQDPLAGFFFIASLASLAEAIHGVRWARLVSAISFAISVARFISASLSR